MRDLRRPGWVLAWALTLLSTAALAEDHVVVAAASSLMDVLPKVAAAWKSAGGKDVTFQFEASSRLAQQINEGAPFDLFISADLEWMDYLEKNGRLERGTRLSLLSNVLVLVLPKGSSLVIKDPAGLATPAIKHLALAGENVPGGRYARAALRNTGVWEAVRERVVNAANARAALELASHQEVDAAIVFKTDAQSTTSVVTAFAFEPNLHPRIVYPAAVVKDAQHARDARRFLDFCHSPQARELFEKAGFTMLKVD